MDNHQCVYIRAFLLVGTDSSGFYFKSAKKKASPKIHSGVLGSFWKHHKSKERKIGTSHRDAFFGAMQLKMCGIERKRSE